MPVTGVAAGLATIHASAVNVADATASVTVTGLAITTTSLNAGQVGTAYSQTLAATGGTAPYNWSITSGALPSGLTLNAASGQIIGTPSTTAANLPLTVHVIDSSSPALGANASLTITIASGSPPASITTTGGTPQSAAIGTAFGTLLTASVRDASNNPVGGATVTFTAPLTGASGSFAGGVNTAVTNASGVATSALFIANGTTGAYTVSAAVGTVATKANFSLNNTAGNPASIVAAGGISQSAVINTAFGTLLTATVKDAASNPLSGVTVTFAAPLTGASGSFTAGVTAVTNASGMATSSIFTANSTAGSYNVTASVSGVASSANFSMTNTAGPAASVTATGGTPQTGTINSTFVLPLTATVKDLGGNPVSGISVTFTAPTTGAAGSFASGAVTSVTTNALGVAISGNFTANAVAGAYTVNASIAGIATPAVFSLTNVSGIVMPANVTVAPGQSVPFPIALGTAAPAGGAFITLTSSDTSKVTVTGNILIPAGATVPLTAPKVNGVAFGSVTITAASSLYPASTQTVLAADTIVFSPGTLTITGSGTQQMFLSLSSPAPAGGLTVNLSSSNTAVATVPATATFIANITSVNVPVTPVGPGTATIQAGAPPSVLNAAGAVTVTGFAITTTALNTGQVGTVYSQTLTATGGTTPYTWAVTSGVLPGGLTLTPTTGQINGTPTATAVNSPLTFKVTDNNGSTATANLTLTVNPAGGVESLSAINGMGQTATVNTAFQNPLVAMVKDGTGSPLSGVTVTFTAPSLGASASFGGVPSTTAVTAANGQATAPTFSANAMAGSYNVIASATGIATPASFALTNTPQVPRPVSRGRVAAAKARRSTLLSRVRWQRL